MSRSKSHIFFSFRQCCLFKWRYNRRNGNCNLSNCTLTRKKFRDFNGIRTHDLCISATVLYQLNYEDPYIGSRPICWMKTEWRWYELKKYRFKWRYDRRSGKYIIIIILCVEGRKGQVLYIVYIGSWNCIYVLMKLSANVYFWHSSTALTNTNTIFYSHFQTLLAHLYFDTEFSNKLDNQADKVWVSMYKLERIAQL